MRKALDLIAEKLPAEFARYADPDLGGPTFSVNMIHGGSKVNIVPDHCQIELDHRSLPAEPPEALAEWLKKELPGFEIDVMSRRPGMATPSDHPHIRGLVKALEQAGQAGPHLEAAPWFADSAVFAEAGIASISFGPGSIRQAHTKDEFIEIGELVRGQQVLEHFVGGLE
jgi:acetylornithine deacetylase/succinyl-diaminopimelate desuccinylase-like protein